jgi:hypothetical protein
MAATNLPLADGTLSWIDSLIGFDRTTVIPPVNAIPWINRASVWGYNSFIVQPFLLLLIATRRSGRAWTLLTAWGFASFGRIAAPLVLLNVAVIASALISGGHYLVDLPAGMLVAGMAIRLAQPVHRQSDDHVAEGRLAACL